MFSIVYASGSNVHHSTDSPVCGCVAMDIKTISISVFIYSIYV